jgi:hypothetical protein
LTTSSVDASLPRKSKNTSLKETIDDWEDYHSHEQINNYIESLAEAHDYVSVVNIGQTYEGREMKVIKITKAGEGAPNVFIEAGW